MRPTLVTPACRRTMEALDEAHSLGELHLPPELMAHVAQCVRCAAEYQETERLFARLRNAPSTLDLAGLTLAVDTVLSATVTQPAAVEQSALPHAALGLTSTPSAHGAKPQSRSHLRWVVGQVAVVAAIVFITVGGLTYAALKVNEAISGTKPGEVVERVIAPLRDWTWARWRETK